MLANAAGVMPDSLKFEADQIFFERGLDGVDVVVHGRHSHEKQRRSDLRKRLILTRRVLADGKRPEPTTTRSSGIPLALRSSRPWRCSVFRTPASA